MSKCNTCDYALYGGMCLAQGKFMVLDDADSCELYRPNRGLELARLKRENEKLRKLVLDMRKAFFTLDIDHCQACPRDNVNGPCARYTVEGSGECDFDSCMRELGIEV